MYALRFIWKQRSKTSKVEGMKLLSQSSQALPLLLLAGDCLVIAAVKRGIG